MTIAVTLPTLANDPTKTILPQRCWITILPTSGSAMVFKITTGGFSRTVEKKKREVAAASGIVSADRSVTTRIENSFKFTLDEFSADVATLMNAAQTDGTARVWAKDPSDGATVAAYMSNEFSCSVSQDGEFSLDPADWTKATFTCEVLGTLTHGFDVSTT